MNHSDTAIQNKSNWSEPVEGATQKGGVTNLQQSISRKLHNVADTLQEKAGGLAGKNQELAGYGKQAADWLNRSADYIEELQPQQLKSDLEKQVRTNPGRSLLIATAAGLVIGALIRRR